MNRPNWLLAALFLQEDVWPLLDEPTNHLDLQGREVISRYLARQRGFLVISHDRAFLDGCTDHILCIEKKKIVLQHGNYSTWEENRECEDDFEAAKYDKLGKEAAHLRKTAGQYSGIRRQKSAESAAVSGTAAQTRLSAGTVLQRDAEFQREAA